MSKNNKYTIDDLETALNNAKAGIDVEKNQDIIIDSKNFNYVLLFAKEVSNANIERIQQFVLNSDDYQYAYLFATNVKGADIEKLSELVLKGKANCYIYWFANEVEGANIQKFIDVLKTRLPADDKYVVRLEEKLAKMKPAKTPEEAYNEAIKGINVKENEKIVLSKKDPRLSYNFAKGVPTADIAAHEKIILDKEDYYFSFEFARTIPGANIQAHIHLMNKDARCVWEAELKEKLKEINDKKFLEEQDKEFLLSLKDDEETLKILEVVRMLEEEEKEAIKEIIFEGNAKFLEDLRKEELKKESLEEQAKIAYENIFYKKIYNHEDINKLIDSKYLYALCNQIREIPKNCINTLYKKIEQKTIESKDHIACMLLMDYNHKDCSHRSLIDVIKTSGDPEDIYWLYDNCEIVTFYECMEVIPKNNDIAINFLFDLIKLEAYGTIDFLKEKHPEIISINYLTKNVICTDDYSDEFKAGIQEAIAYLNSKNKPELVKKDMLDKDKEETLQYIDFWIKEIKPNDLYAIEILKNIIENKFYDRIDILKQYHPDVININFLKKKINGNYPDDYKHLLEEAITYLSSVEKPKPIKETNWLKENAIEGIYQGISQTVVKNLAKSIIELLKLKNIDEPSIYLAEKFLSSPIGISILLALIGAGIHFIPAKLTQDNIHIQKVGDKCIQSCTAIGSEHLINLAMNFVLPAITNAVSSNKQISVMEMLEAKPKVRVNIEEDSDLDLYEKLTSLASAN